jgi:hypothetical protein
LRKKKWIRFRLLTRNKPVAINQQLAGATTMKQAAKLTLLAVYVRLQMLSEFSCLGGGSLYITFNRIDRLQRRTSRDVDQNVLEYLYRYSGTSVVLGYLYWSSILRRISSDYFAAERRRWSSVTLWSCTPAPRVEA